MNDHDYGDANVWSEVIWRKSPFRSARESSHGYHPLTLADEGKESQQV
jgi:hypothetical protein